MPSPASRRPTCKIPLSSAAHSARMHRRPRLSPSDLHSRRSCLASCLPSSPSRSPACLELSCSPHLPRPSLRTATLTPATSRAAAQRLPPIPRPPLARPSGAPLPQRRQRRRRHKSKSCCRLRLSSQSCCLRHQHRHQRLGTRPHPNCWLDVACARLRPPRPPGALRDTPRPRYRQPSASCGSWRRQCYPARQAKATPQQRHRSWGGLPPTSSMARRPPRCGVARCDMQPSLGLCRASGRLRCRRWSGR